MALIISANQACKDLFAERVRETCHQDAQLHGSTMKMPPSLLGPVMGITGIESLGLPGLRQPLEFFLNVDF